ncbi:AAA family ATPase [bacterium SCSIO 12643]|nr:AAA family ATPase [bacterium SCSIO 12643]
MHIPNIIQYYHDCYRSDNRELVIFDFLNRKVENKVFFDGKEELLNNLYPIKSFPKLKAENIIKKLKLYSKEKELLYGSFFICGQYVDQRGIKNRLCAPLFYYPAEVTYKDEFYYASINATHQKLNYPLIQMLMEGEQGEIFNDPLFQNLSKSHITFGDMSKLKRICNKYFPQLNTDYVLSYPDNVSIKTVKSKIQQVITKDSDELFLFPTSIMGIVSKSTNTRGVLNELTELYHQQDFSIPLKSIFDTDQIQPEYKPYQRTELPMILSAAQSAILKSASSNPLTTIIGPPGTGKTYTIGAIAMDHMSRGESVLIASRTDEAVDVIMHKISDLVGIDRCVVRGGRKRTYSTSLNRFLKALLTRVRKLRYLQKEFDVNLKGGFYELVEKTEEIRVGTVYRRDWIEELENQIVDAIDIELKWGRHLSEEDKTIWNKLKTRYLKFRNSVQTPLWEHSEKLHQYDQSQIQKVRLLIRQKYIIQILEVLQNNWGDLKSFYEAIKLASDTERLSRFQDIHFKAILKAFPIWLTSLTEVKNVLPFEKELFDVVIIDEATQCDIASCLPMIQRAKRVVIAGDPNQLRHVSFLSRGMQELYKEKYRLQNFDSSMLNYRDKSILDLVMSSLNSGDQVAMLDEHFRSKSSIIHFSNKHFYDDGLKVMTSRPDEREESLVIVQCNGHRTKDGVNREEIKQLLEDVVVLIQSEKDIDTDQCTTIGILSPFRSQVEAIEGGLHGRVSIEEIEKHKLRIGTAYSFQGDERDVMFLSFVVDPNSHHSALIHINKEDVFNVAITRARNKQYVYVSVTPKDLKTNSVLYSYLAKGHKTIHSESDNNLHDRFLAEVRDYIQEIGILTSWEGFMIAGTTLDLLVKSNDTYVAIDLIGYPGEYEHSFGVERYRILNRAGVRIFPLSYSDWYFDREVVQETLKNVLFRKTKIRIEE